MTLLPGGFAQGGHDRSAEDAAVAAGGDAAPTEAAASSPGGGNVGLTLSPAPPAAGPSAAPLSRSTGWIAGRVTGPDGLGRAEIPVRAAAGDGSLGPDGVAYTDLAGQYALAVPPGEWIVHVEAAAYRLQWYPRSPTPFGSVAVPVRSGARTGDVDFVVAGNPPACVVGRVTRADGSPVDRALVLALPAMAAGGMVTETVPLGVAFTAADGSYRLFVEPGVVVVGVSPNVLLAPADWWLGKPTAGQADGLPVHEGARNATVDFVLGAGRATGAPVTR